MTVLDRSQHYIFRIGSQNQHRFHWTGSGWHYEFLAGGVLFDEQFFSNDDELSDALAMHGMSPEQFKVDEERIGETYSAAIKTKIKELERHGIDPCPKHGLVLKNLDGTCEACLNPEFPDDHKGAEG